jgi:hypothetical protein
MPFPELLNIFALIAGVVAVIELLEYVFTKNIPWLVRLATNLTRRVRRWLGRGPAPAGERYLVLNFSAHPLLPGQRQAIQTRLDWPRLEVVDAWLGNVSEDHDFVAEVVRYVDKIDLLPQEWQTCRLVTVPAGYAPAWTVLLAELHGRLGYFPDIVRLRPAPAPAEEKFEVAEIVPTQAVRNRARAKR